MKKIIRKILREHKSDRHYRMLDKISDHVHLPYFKSMEDFAIDEKDDQLYIMRKILGNDIYISVDVINTYYYVTKSDDKGNLIYFEYPDGRWKKWEYDDNGKQIYYEHSNGFWYKWEYDDNGNLIYLEDSYGDWEKTEYDDKGNQIYFEKSTGYWLKENFDDNGNQIYFENSYGYIIDNR